MPRHHVDIELPAKAILNNNVRFTVWSDDVKLGELFISKGGIDWKAAKKQKPISMTWESFQQRMEDEGVTGTRVRRTTKLR